MTSVDNNSQSSKDMFNILGLIFDKDGKEMRWNIVDNCIDTEYIAEPESAIDCDGKIIYECKLIYNDKWDEGLLPEPTKMLKLFLEGD